MGHVRLYTSVMVQQLPKITNDQRRQMLRWSSDESASNSLSIRESL
jgi:hypothetical protein